MSVISHCLRVRSRLRSDISRDLSDIRSRRDICDTCDTGDASDVIGQSGTAVVNWPIEGVILDRSFLFSGVDEDYCSLCLSGVNRG